MTPPKGEQAARLRAAVAYSALKQPEAAARLNVSATSLSRMENGRGAITLSNEAIAEAFGVPIAFMEHGFAPLAAPISDVERRIYEMEEAVERRLAMVERGAELLAAIDENEDHVRRALDGEEPLELRRLMAERVAGADRADLDDAARQLRETAQPLAGSAIPPSEEDPDAARDSG